MEREGGRDYLPLCHFLALCTIQGGLCQFHEMSLQCRAGARRVFTDEGGSGLGGYAMSNKYILRSILVSTVSSVELSRISTILCEWRCLALSGGLLRPPRNLKQARSATEDSTYQAQAAAAVVLTKSLAIFRG